MKVGVGHRLYQSGVLRNAPPQGGMVVFHGGVMELCQYCCVLLYITVILLCVCVLCVCILVHR